MIVDSIFNLKMYSHLHKLFPIAFNHLSKLSTDSIKNETIELSGKDLFLITSIKKGRSKNDAYLESHQRYIDIQFCLSGVDQIGWKSTKICSNIKEAYQPEADICFYFDLPEKWYSILPNYFAIIFPEDAHAPSVSEDILYKAIIKVAI